MPVPNRRLARVLFEKAAVDLPGANMFRDEGHSFLGLQTVHESFRRDPRAVATLAQHLERARNGHSRTTVNLVREAKAGPPESPSKHQRWQPLALTHEVEGDEGLVVEGIASGVRKGEPLSHESFAGLKQGPKACFMVAGPRRPEPSASIPRLRRKVPCTPECDDVVSDSCSRDARAVELLLNNDHEAARGLTS